MQNKNYQRNKSPCTRRSQGGWTFWSLAFTVTVVMIFAYVAMRLVPVYSANNNIRNAMQQSVVGQDLRRVTKRTIVRKMDEQLYLDGSHKIIDYKDAVQVSRGRNKLLIDVDYERRVPLFFNLSLLVDFSPSLECDFNGQCYELAERLK